MEHVFRVKKFPDAKSMGIQAAAEAGELLRDYTGRGKRVVAVFAAAPSQDAFLEQLAVEKDIDWGMVEAFHLDEYHDLPEGHPNTFELYLREHIFGKVPIPDENVKYIKTLKGSPDEVAAGYSRGLKSAVQKAGKEGGLYINFIGIGVNGHIAFNEPGADMWTDKWMAPIEIDDVSVKQQFDDYKNHPNPQARYANMRDVPRKALTMTPAAILASDIIFAMVPGEQKANAVKASIEGPVTEKVPASLLRLHENTTIFIDAESGRGLTRKPAAG